MKVLVTGGLGRLGRFVVQELIARGHKVVVADIVEGKIDGTESILCDCTNLDSVRRVVSNIDAVIHLAAIPNPKMGTSPDIFNINCRGTYYLYEACAETGIRKISVASSINALGARYGVKELDVRYFPIDEDHPQLCSDAYSFSKQVTEEIGEFFWHKDKISSISVRFPSIHMPTPDGKVKKWKKIEDPGHPDFRRNFWTWIDSRDAARVMVLGVEVSYEGAHVLHCNHSLNVLNMPSRELATCYYPNVSQWKKDFSGCEALVSSDRAKALLGWEAEYH